MTILDKIVAATRLRVAREQAEVPLVELQKPTAPARIPFAFTAALAGEGMAFICEVKKASPSKGVIAADFPYRRIAREYEAAGAAAISVLTEPDFFQGSDRYLAEIRQEVAIPLLRKDFVIDPYQINQAHYLGADAVLLICAILTDEELAAYLKLADSLGLSCLVEAHDRAEVDRALAAGAKIIGVNNRDLRTFEVDTGNSIRLRAAVPRAVLFVSESGITTGEDVALLQAHGVDAVLVGERLMRSEDKKAALAALGGKPHGSM